MTTRRFPPPWSVEETDPKLGRQSYIHRDARRVISEWVVDELGNQSRTLSWAESSNGDRA
jgi:hypothetical protein